MEVDLTYVLGHAGRNATCIIVTSSARMAKGYRYVTKQPPNLTRCKQVKGNQSFAANSLIIESDNHVVLNVWGGRKVFTDSGRTEAERFMRKSNGKDLKERYWGSNTL